MPDTMREQVVAALEDAGMPLDDLYIDDAVETWETQAAQGKKLWPVEIFALLTEHRMAVGAGNEKRQRELEREIYHLQGGKGDPWLSDEERAAARKAVRSLLREKEQGTG